MVEWSIAAFRACESVGSVVVARPPGESPGSGDGATSEAGAEVLDGLGVETVEGGATRPESVRNALAAVGTELVAIHDAARPLLTPELVEGVVATLSADPGAAGAIAATPVSDTIKRAMDRRLLTSPHQSVVKTAVGVEETLDRERLWAAQTPQVFRTEALRQAFEREPEAIAAATDEAMLVEAAGGKVLIHPSSPENLKVTTPLDLRVAEVLLAERIG